MHNKKFSTVHVRQYSELVHSAVRLGVNFDDLISETRKFHGIEFGDRVEVAVRAMRRHR